MTSLHFSSEILEFMMCSRRYLYSTYFDLEEMKIQTNYEEKEKEKEKEKGTQIKEWHGEITSAGLRGRD
jgi:hypothetical protein